MELKDICQYVSEKVATTTLTKENYISTENMLPDKGGIVIASGVPFGNSTAFSVGDVLVSNIRPYFRKIWLANRNGGCSADVLCFRANSNVDNSYFYYLLSQQEFFDYIMSGAKGCKMPRGDKRQIMQWKVELPPLDEQRHIASVLSSLDSKIELNHRINRNLEQQAQALFKAWFVDFEPFKNGKFVDSELGKIPEGWKVVELGKVTKHITERVGQKNDIKVLSPITTGELVLSEEYFTKQVFSENIAKYIIVKPKQFAYNPARVNIGSLGMNTFTFTGCVSPVYVVFECENRYEHFFDCLRKTKSFKEEVISRAIGGVRQSLGYKDFSLIKTIYPPKQVIIRFNELYLKLLQLRRFNIKENDSLSSLRDTLLPKLMSGELNVNTITE